MDDYLHMDDDDREHAVEDVADSRYHRGMTENFVSTIRRNRSEFDILILNKSKLKNDVDALVDRVGKFEDEDEFDRLNGNYITYSEDVERIRHPETAEQFSDILSDARRVMDERADGILLTDRKLQALERLVPAVNTSSEAETFTADVRNLPSSRRHRDLVERRTQLFMDSDALRRLTSIQEAINEANTAPEVSSLQRRLMDTRATPQTSDFYTSIRDELRARQEAVRELQQRGRFTEPISIPTPLVSRVVGTATALDQTFTVRYAPARARYVGAERAYVEGGPVYSAYSQETGRLVGLFTQRPTGRDIRRRLEEK